MQALTFGALELLDAESVGGQLLGQRVAFLAAHRRELLPDAIVTDLFRTGRARRTLHCEIRGLTGHILGAPGHKPRQSHGITIDVISQFPAGSRSRPGSVQQFNPDRGLNKSEVHGSCRDPDSDQDRVLAVICRQLDSVPSRRVAEIGTSAHIGPKKPVREPLSIPGPARKNEIAGQAPTVRTFYASSTTRCSRHSPRPCSRPARPSEWVAVPTPPARQLQPDFRALCSLAR
jgi:hypothetical protein